MRRIALFDPNSRRARFSHYFTLAYCGVALLFALYLRNDVLYATTEFRNNEVGIVAYYPSGWLLDTSSAVMRATDSARSGFKTVLQIQVLPFAPQMSANNIIYSLTLERQETLPYYRNLTTFEIVLDNQDEAVVSEYSFVDAPTDPFLEAVTTSVLGRDVLVVRRNQAILITFQADRSTFYDDLAIFDRFLSALDY